MRSSEGPAALPGPGSRPNTGRGRAECPFWWSFWVQKTPPDPQGPDGVLFASVGRLPCPLSRATERDIAAHRVEAEFASASSDPTFDF